MDEFNSENSYEEKNNALGLTKVVSPSDLSYNNFSPSRVQSSSPVSSNLPALFSTLRAKSQSNSSDVSQSRSFLKKLLHTNKSSDDLTQTESCKLIFRRNSSKSISSSEDFNESTYEASTENDIDLNPQLFSGIGQIKVPSIFLKDGLPLLKISHKSRKRLFLNIDTNNFRFILKYANNSASIPTSNGIHKVFGSSTNHSSKSKTYEFSIDDIRTITFQADASNYREELNVSKGFEQQWITIIYFNHKKGKLKSLHLIADTDHDFKKLQSVIKNLKKLRDSLAKNLFVDFNEIDDVQKSIIFGKHEDKTTDKQVREFLFFDDILKYSKRLNINVNDDYLKSIFDEVAATEEESPRGLNFEKFKIFVSKLKKRDDVIQIWNIVCGENKIMNFELFQTFTREIQGETFSDEQAYKIFKKFSISEKDYWIPESLNNFLLSKYSSAFHSICEEKAYFDYPLNEYYISSSHNTYLMGRQVAGDSSVEGYIKALQRGCRCVEVDIWDGNIEESMPESVESEPIVSHGRTFTTAISFTNVIKTIKKYAFMTSFFPLIISLEVNCSPDNQMKVVQILREVLGDTLVTKPIDNNSILPSPSRLKHKILMKVKKTSPFYNLIQGGDGNYISTPSTTTTTTSFSEDSGTSISRRNSFRIRRKTSGTKVIDNLTALGVYLQGLKFRNFSLPESKTFNHCFSLKEKSINLMLKDDVKRGSVDKHNRKYFMRVYPSQIRLTSSNFLPLSYWEHGVQMVATNWQTYDLGQQLNESMFEGVGKKGYVLKPKELRTPITKNTQSQILYKKLHKIRFEIEIISAHQLPRPKGSTSAINPFISLEIIGASDIQWDMNSIIKRTSIVSANGFNPRWNEKFSGIITVANDLAFVKFLVNSSSSSKEEEEVRSVGLLVSKLSYMQQGYRYLPINDLSGEELIYSSLFVKIRYYNL